MREIPTREERLCYLLVFGQRIRQQAGRSGKPIRAGSVEDSLLAVGEALQHMGVPDPRKEAPGNPRNDPLCASYLAALRNEDDPASRVQPINTTILENLYEVLDFEHPIDGEANRATVDLTIAAFFWLMRPAECACTGNEDETRSGSFRLNDIKLQLNGRTHDALTAPLHDGNEHLVTQVTLTFTDQKNAVRGEQITHNATDHPLLCPCKSIARRVRHLIQHTADGTSPISTFFDSRGARQVHSVWVTNALRHAARPLEAVTGIKPALISARSLRPGGATALLCADIESDVIKLLGRWKSDAMLRHLRVAAQAQRKRLAQAMLTHGNCTFSPDVTPDSAAEQLPNEAPATITNFLDGDALDGL